MKPATLTILADTREQRIPPFPDGVSVEVATLSEGDYSTPFLRGFVRIERKSTEDFASSIGAQHDRFFREAERLRPYQFKAIVVEGALEHLLTGRVRSRIHPAAVLSKVCSLHARYGIPTIFAGDAVTCGRIIAGLLRRLEEEHARAGAV